MIKKQNKITVLLAILTLIFPLCISCAGGLDNYLRQQEYRNAQKRMDAEAAGASNTLAKDLARVSGDFEKSKPESKAKIIRGTSQIAIDFAKAADRQKIKDFDVIQLEAGRYSTLGDTKARGVRFTGKSRTETFISNQKGKPIFVNETEFWDVGIVDTKFQAVDSRGFHAIQSSLLGDIIVDSNKGAHAMAYTASTGLSEITHAKLGTGPASHALSFKRSGDSIRAGDYSGTAVGSQINWMAQVKAMGDATIEKGPATFNPEMVNYLNGNNMVNLYLQEIANPKPLSPTNAAVYGTTSRVLHYLTAKAGLKVPIDEAKYKSFLKMGQEALKKGNKLMGLALLEEADRVSGYTHHDDLRRIASEPTNKLRDSLSCAIKTKNEASSIFERDVAAKLRVAAEAQFPILTMAAGGKKCEVNYAAMMENLGQKKLDNIIGSKAYKEETTASRLSRDQALAKQADLAAAAERSAAKARQDRMNAANEASKEVTRKAAVGQFRIEEVGGQKSMVYGSGDWSGHATAATKNSYEKNTADAARLSAQAREPQAGGGPQFETVNRSVHQTGTVDSMKVNSQSAVRIGGMTKILQGSNKIMNTQNSCTFTRNGAFTNDLNCQNTTDFKPDEEVRLLLAPLTTLLRTEMYSAQIKESGTKSKSSDPVTQLEGLLLASVLNPKADPAALEAAAEKVFGRKRSASNLIISAFAF